MDTVQQDLKMKVLNSNSSSITELTWVGSKVRLSGVIILAPLPAGSVTLSESFYLCK